MRFADRFSALFRPTIILVVLCAIFAALPACSKKRDPGNTLRLAQREKYRTLDPLHANEHYSGIATRRAYEGLVQYHYLKRPYTVVPNLAEAMPEVSKDGKTYTFKIKKGVLFHDDKAFKDGKGRELTAEDFIYSWKRLADPKNLSEGWWIFDSRILGLNEWRDQMSGAAKTDYDVPVEGLKAVDKHTLQIKLVKPHPLLLHLLTMPYAVVLPREAVEFHGKNFQNKPVGTGPFKLESLSSNQLVWVRNPTYRQETYPSDGEESDKAAGRLADAGKPIPFVDKIIDDIVVEDQPAWLNFMQSNHDYMLKATKDNVNVIVGPDGKPTKELLDRGIDFLTVPGSEFGYVAFNQADPQVGGPKNKFLRQAMSLAYDEGPAIEKFYLSLAKKTHSVIPPGIAGYDPNYKNPYREYNLAKAREILAKAGHPGGQGIPELVYDSRADSTSRQISEYFQRSMAQLGIKVRINPMTWPELNSRISKKQAQMWGIFWLYDYPDAENGWQLLYSKNEAPGSNKSNYNNPKFDALYEKTSVMPDSPQRNALYKQMREIIAEDCPMIFTMHRNENRLAHPWVRNLKVHAFEHNVEKYLRLDVESRAKALK